MNTIQREKKYLEEYRWKKREHENRVGEARERENCKAAEMFIG